MVVVERIAVGSPRTGAGKDGLRSGLIDFRLFHGPINLLRSARERQTPESRLPNKTQIVPPQSGLVQQESAGNGFAVASDLTFAKIICALPTDFFRMPGLLPPIPATRSIDHIGILFLISKIVRISLNTILS